MVEDASSLADRVFENENPVRVTQAMIANFCAATGENNPLYIDAETAKHGPHGGLVAPPSFAAIFGNSETIFRRLPQYDKRRLAAGMEVEFLLPIRAGDTIRATSRVKQIYEKTGRSGAMVFIVIATALNNQNGELAVRLEHRFTTRRDDR